MNSWLFSTNYQVKPNWFGCLWNFGSNEFIELIQCMQSYNLYLDWDKLWCILFIATIRPIVLHMTAACFIASNVNNSMRNLILNLFLNGNHTEPCITFCSTSFCRLCRSISAKRSTSSNFRRPLFFRRFGKSTDSTLLLLEDTDTERFLWNEQLWKIH